MTQSGPKIGRPARFSGLGIKEPTSPNQAQEPASGEGRTVATKPDARVKMRAEVDPCASKDNREKRAFRARSRHPNHSQNEPVYAALDLGTNNCRLLMAQPTRHGFRVVDSYSRIVRLGAGLSSNNKLSETAMDKAVEALAVCRDKMQARHVERSRLIATEACRRASNGPDFIQRVADETGLDLEIVDRRTEARLAVSGCGTLVEREADGVILFDIGGGSTELAFLDFRSGKPRFHAQMHRFIRAWTSLPVGVVTLAESFGGVHVDLAVFENMVDTVREMISSFAAREMMQQCVSGGKVHLLGTSGTVTTLAGVHLGLDRYDRRQVDGTWMGADDVTSMTDRLIGMTFEERVANPCIGADRADLVLAGCAIFEAIRREWPCGRLRVADRGLREGMLVELMAQDGVWRRNRGGGSQNARYRGQFRRNGNGKPANGRLG